MQTNQTVAKPKIYDPSFQYVSAEHTDIRKTFEKAQAAIAQKQQSTAEIEALINSWFIEHLEVEHA